MQRALLVNTAFSLLIMALWLKSETLFLALGQVGYTRGELRGGGLGQVHGVRHRVNLASGCTPQAAWGAASSGPHI